MALVKVKEKKGPGHEYINPDLILKVDVFPQRYKVTMSNGWSFYADKTDVAITNLISAADA